MTNTAITEKSVSIHVTRDEFQLLSSVISPLYFDESKGASVWVSSEPDGSRAWTVRDNEGSVAIVTTQGALAIVNNGDDTNDDGWAYPVSESVLIGIGRFLLVGDLESDDCVEFESSEVGDVVLTLSDSRSIVRGAGMEVSVPRNHRTTTPPMRPDVADRISFEVDPVKLWCVLTQARTWPASGECHGMNTPMVCRVDPSSDEMCITVDWSSTGNGVSTFRLPIEWRMRHQQNGPTEFVLPHANILSVVRDPHNAHHLERVTIQLGDADSSHVLVWGPNWHYYVPAIPDVTMWGHDLDAVLGDTTWHWKNAALVKVWPRELEGAVDLTTLPDDASHAPYRYRVSYVVCPDIVPTISLYAEINHLNEKTAGYRLVVDGNRVVALTDYTPDNYRELDKHITAFARQVRELPTLLTALSVS